MPDFTQISPKLHRASDGVWYSDEHSKISYPDQANQWCNEVEDASYWFEHRNRIIINAIRLFPPQGWLADIGGGNGFVAQALQREGFEVVLIEPGKDGIRMAQARIQQISVPPSKLQKSTQLLFLLWVFSIWSSTCKTMWFF